MRHACAVFGSFANHTSTTAAAAILLCQFGAVGRVLFPCSLAFGVAVLPLCAATFGTLFLK